MSSRKQQQRNSSKGDQDQFRLYATDAVAPDRAAYAAYIRDMAFELRSLAEKNGMVVLAYFLDMAHEEAGLQARGVAKPG